MIIEPERKDLQDRTEILLVGDGGTPPHNVRITRMNWTFEQEEDHGKPVPPSRISTLGLHLADRDELRNYIALLTQALEHMAALDSQPLPKPKDRTQRC